MEDFILKYSVNPAIAIINNEKARKSSKKFIKWIRLKIKKGMRVSVLDDQTKDIKFISSEIHVSAKTKWGKK